jgi:rare lipoprotein A
MAMLFAASIFLTPQTGAEIVTASWYGEEVEGRLMANGQPFDPSALTCASWDYPFGTLLRVTHKARAVIVTVTDRGPAKRLYRKGRKLDLSRAAFACLASLKLGIITVDITRVKKHK